MPEAGTAGAAESGVLGFDIGCLPVEYPFNDIGLRPTAVGAVGFNEATGSGSTVRNHSGSHPNDAAG